VGSAEIVHAVKKKVTTIKVENILGILRSFGEKDETKF